MRSAICKLSICFAFILKFATLYSFLESNIGFGARVAFVVWFTRTSGRQNHFVASTAGATRGGGVARATAPGPVRGPRLQSEVKATDNTRSIDD